MLLKNRDVSVLIFMLKCSDSCSTSDGDKSLMTLERVMSTLANRGSNSPTSGPPVPYKDSVSIKQSRLKYEIRANERIMGCVLLMCKMKLAYWWKKV